MKASVFAIVMILSGTADAQQSAPAPAEPTLYYQTTDYSVMVCKTAREAVVANLISHGLSFGDTQAQGQWLAKARGEKTCMAVEPGKKFVTSPATAVYMRSLNNVKWAVQMLVPSTGESLGYVPLDEISFLPIPTL